MRPTLHVFINYYKLFPLCSFVLSVQRHAGMAANGDHQARTFHSAAWMYAFKPMQSRRENDRRILDTTISMANKEMDTCHGTTTGGFPLMHKEADRSLAKGVAFASDGEDPRFGSPPGSPSLFSARKWPRAAP